MFDYLFRLAAIFVFSPCFQGRKSGRREERLVNCQSLAMEKMNGVSGTTSTGSNASGSKRKEIYKYEAPWTVYAMNWSVRPDKRFRLALGSFIEEYNNKVQIVTLDEENSEFYSKSSFDHPYPTTKIMWIPDGKGLFPDLLATSGDYLRVWRATDNETRLECLLNNVSICAKVLKY